MLLQNTTPEYLVDIIKMNGGSIDTYNLSKILTKRHGDVKDKVDQNFGYGNFAPKQVIVITGKGKEEAVDAYILPETEALAIAMSYSVQLGMVVAGGFKLYREALEAIQQAETLEAAQEIAKETLDQRLFNAIGSKHGRVGTLIKEAYDENTPTKAHKLVESVYLAQDPVFANDKAYRDKFISAWFRAMDVAIEEAHEDGDTMLKTWLEARKGDVHAIRGRILKRRLTFAEKQVEQLKAQVQTPEVKAEIAELIQEVQETSNVIEMFDYNVPMFTPEEIAASRIH